MTVLPVALAAIHPFAEELPKSSNSTIGSMLLRNRGCGMTQKASLGHAFSGCGEASFPMILHRGMGVKHGGQSIGGEALGATWTNTMLRHL